MYLIKNRLFLISFLFVTLFSLLFVTPRKASASTLILDENFNTSTLANWNVLSGDSSQLVSDLNLGYLTTYNVNSVQTSYLILRNPLPSMDVGIDIRFRVLGDAFVQGAGIGVTDSYLALRNIPVDSTSYVFVLWPYNSSGTWGFPVAFCPNDVCTNSNLSSFLVENASQSGWHTLHVEYKEDKYTFTLDNSSPYTTQSTTRRPKYIWIGNPEIADSSQSGYARIELDYVKSTLLSSVFPYLSQKDAAWGSKEYDSAGTWAPGKMGIDRWGCALTSAAMILQHNSVEMPDGGVANPDTLNDWLKAQPDGYVGGGLLNWLAISRLSKQSEEASHSAVSLEYSRTPYDPTALTTPSILGLPGHFVVGTGSTADTIDILDPNDETHTSLTATTSGVQTVGVYTPSHTDLSYMLFVTNAGTTTTLYDEGGSAVPSHIFDESLSDDVDGSATISARLAYVPKPASGNYRLTTTGGDGSLDVYFYDAGGGVQRETLPLPSGGHTFSLTYNHDTVGLSTISELDVTPPPVPTLLSPANGTHIPTAGLVLDWSDETDPSGPVTYQYRSTWESGSYGPVATGTNSYIPAGGSADHTYMWSVQACDSADNCSAWSEPWSLVVDSTPPKVDLSFGPPGPSTTAFTAIYSEPVVEGEATDPANYFLQNWPGEGGSGPLTGHATVAYDRESYTATITFITPGWYISPEQMWGVQGVHDLAGNALATNPYAEYSTPMTSPTAPGSPVTAPNPTNLLSQTWNWTGSSDTGSGIKGYWQRMYDALSAPVGSYAWIGNVLGVSTTLTDGQWKMEVYAEDRAGNTGGVTTSSALTVDTIPPTTPTMLGFLSPTVTCGGYTNSKLETVDWSDATDGGSGIAGYDYAIDYPFPIGTGRGHWQTFFTASQYRGSLNEGLHTISVRAKDNAGNYSPWSAPCDITYDSIAPTLADKSTFAGWHNTPQTSVFSYTDTNLPATYASPTCDITAEGVGSTCTVSPSVCDLAGNCVTDAVTSNPANIDVTAPIVEIGLWGSEIAGSAGDTLSGIAYVDVHYTKDGGAETIVRASGTAAWNYFFPSPIVGSYDVTVYAYDLAGNESAGVTKTFTVNAADSPQTFAGTIAGASTEVNGVTSPVGRGTVPPATGEVLGATLVPEDATPSATPTPLPSNSEEPAHVMNHLATTWWLWGGVAAILAVIAAYLWRRATK